MSNTDSNTNIKTTLSLLVAMSNNRVIGRDGDMPWRQSADLKRFKKLTMDHAILMGRKTFESIGRPLPGRQMIVISRQDVVAGAPELAASLEAAIEMAHGREEIFIVGGGEIYLQSLPLANRIYLTCIDAEIDGDTYFPPLSEDWQRISCEEHQADARNQYDYRFEIWEKERGES